MQRRVLKSWPCPGTRVSSLIFLGRKEGSLVKMGAAEASGTGKKDCGVSWGKLDTTSKTYFQTNHFLRHKLYKMIGFGAWKLTWGNHFVRRQFLFFFGFTGVCWGITPSLVPNPFCKPLNMDVCKVNCWVPLKMVALTSPGKCAGGCISIMFHHCY